MSGFTQLSPSQKGAPNRFDAPSMAGAQPDIEEEELKHGSNADNTD
jgi:hypothetical protein